MKMRAVFSVLTLSFLLILPAPASAAALQGYISIKGAKQGQLKGDSFAGPILKNDWIPILGMGFGVTSPRDPASGLPTGKRLHKPLTITKEWGSASPQIYQALITNENLLTVKIDFYQTSADSTNQLAYSIKLDNAAVADVTQSTAPCVPGSRCSLLELESVSFTFKRIEITNLISKTSVIEDLSAELAQ